MKKAAIIGGSIIFALTLLVLTFGAGINEGEKESGRQYDLGYEAGYGQAQQETAETATEVEDTEAKVDSTNTPSVAILSHSPHQENGNYVVVGEVQNNTGRLVESVEIIVTFYDSNYEVVATGDTFAQIDTLRPLYCVEAPLIRRSRPRRPRVKRDQQTPARSSWSFGGRLFCVIALIAKEGLQLVGGILRGAEYFSECIDSQKKNYTSDNGEYNINICSLRVGCPVGHKLKHSECDIGTYDNAEHWNH